MKTLPLIFSVLACSTHAADCKDIKLYMPIGDYKPTSIPITKGQCINVSGFTVDRLDDKKHWRVKGKSIYPQPGATTAMLRVVDSQGWFYTWELNYKAK